MVGRAPRGANPVEYILRQRELGVAADAREEEKQTAHEQEARAWKVTEDALRRLAVRRSTPHQVRGLGYAPGNPARAR